MTYAFPRTDRTVRVALLTTVTLLVLLMATLLHPSDASAAVRYRATRATPVFVVGDSLTVGSAPYIYRQYQAGGVPVTIDAQVGRSTATGVNILATSPAAQRAKVWVVALGTNDAMSEQEYLRYVTRVVALAGKQRVVVWINVHRPGWDGGENAAIARIDRMYANVLSVNFKAQLASRPGYIARDGIHMTTAGYAWRATLYGPTF